MAEPTSRPSSEAGFTLIEAITALGVFSMAAIALLNIGAQNARMVTALEMRTFARIVAGNELALVLASEETPRVGPANGETMLAGREWAWRRTVEKTSDRDILRITVTVMDGETPVATSTAFWGTY